MAGFRKQDIIPATLTKKQLSDAGMALVLILLLIGFFTKDELWYKIAILALLFNMAIPFFYRPFAWFWYSLSNLLGYIVSRVLMTIIYTIMVLPVGLLIRLIGKDSLKLKLFKKGSVSVMEERNYTYSGKDLLRPF